MENIRTIIFYKSYFLDFYNAVGQKVQDKIEYILDILATQQIVPMKFIKYIENSDGIYELRVSAGSNEYRILCFFESGSLIEGGKVVVLGNSFLKKDKKDYKKALEKAQKIRTEYFEENKID